MIKTYKYNDLIWYDLENPAGSEISKVMTEFSIPKEAAEDLLSPTPKQRVSVYDNCVYIVLHFPALRSTKNKDHRQEIDFIIGKKFLITVHYDKMGSIDKFSKFLNSKGAEAGGIDEANAGFIFHRLIKHLYHSLLHDVEIIKEELHQAENSIFKGEERKMVIVLSKIHRDILRFKNAILPHSEAIATLHGVFRKFLGEEYEYFIHDMSSEYQRVERRMQHNKDLLDELRLTNNSLLSTKQNEAMKGLTMMAFFTFPLTLIASIFSMKTIGTPIIGTPKDFWIVLGIMGVVTFCIFGIFSYKKWL